MLAELEDHHRRIVDGIAEVRRLCAASVPDGAALGAARLRLSQASTARSRFLNETVIPALQRNATQALHAELITLQRAFSAKRQASSDHVSQWSSKAILADWQGYRRAAKIIWAMMEEQIERERSIICARLR